MLKKLDLKRMPVYQVHVVGPKYGLYKQVFFCIKNKQRTLEEIIK